MKSGAQRYVTYLQTRYQSILFFLGLTWFFTGIALFIPLIMCFLDNEPLTHKLSFFIPGFAANLLGFLAMKSVKGLERVNLNFQEGALVVTLAWSSAFAIGTVPFFFGMNLPFHLAFFESTSGWTTTGMTIINPDTTARSFLLFRSFTQFIGGAGLVILTLSAAAGPVGSSLSAAEGRSEYLVPNVRKSAKLVLTIYLILASLTCVALWLAGMMPFDAINHAMVAVSTGGFSTRSESLGYWDSPVMEAIILVAVSAGAANFATLYSLLIGKGQAAYKSGEIRTYIFFISISVALLSLFVTSDLFQGHFAPVRHATFAAVSAMTGTGLSTHDYTHWGGFAFVIFLILMVVGGATGSTAAGIKQFRVYAIYRALLWDFKKMFLPVGAYSQPDIWQGAERKFLSSTAISQISLYVLFYIGCLLAGSILFLMHGYSMQDSVFEFTSSLGNVGLSSGITNADMPKTLIWTQIGTMFLGRLEIFAVVIGFTKLFGDVGFLCKNVVTKR